MSETRVVISPHLDDETLCLGGSMARWVSHGDHVVVIEMFNDSTICNGKLVDANTRADELQRALDILGVKDIRFVFSGRGLEDNSHNASIGEAVGIIEGMFDSRKNRIHLCVPEATEHQDHRFVSQVGHVLMRMSRADSATFYSYPMPYRAFDKIICGMYIDVTGFLDKKRVALSKFETQVRTTGNMAVENVIMYNKMLGESFGFTGKAFEKVILQRSFV